MRKEKFVYNTQTLRYEKVVEPMKMKVLRLFGFLSAVVITSIIIISIAFAYFPSPKEKALIREIEQMKYKYIALNNELDMMSKVLGNIKERDGSVHRMLFGMDPIDNDLWEGGIGGSNKYSDMTNFKHSGELLISTQEKAESLKRQMTVQSKSLDTLTFLTKDKENMLASIPAIKPIRSDKLKRNIRSLSGFGFRIHPIYKRRRMHWGIDFTSPKGTPVRSTGNGRIVSIKKSQSGYGKNITVDHGYGYKTLYAHLSSIDCKLGQEVKRGQVIGKVGSTGTSTAPHLHYEVIYKGKKVDPIHYCMDGLTPQEYQELVDLAATSNQSFD